MLGDLHDHAFDEVVRSLAHELGHYLTARWTGMKVTQFFLFFGPRLWSFRRGETEYGIRAIPLGAFVRIVGHEPLWMSLLGDNYQRVAKLAVEEFIELIGYFLWLIGTIEYTYEARAIAYREPKPAAQRRPHHPVQQFPALHEREGTTLDGEHKHLT